MSGQRTRITVDPRAPVFCTHGRGQVHAGDCCAAGNRSHPVDRDEASWLLASTLPACPHCQPDIELRILD
ncbi:DUF6233 domain-containing protein [Streptomyces coeruleorubidus]|uniref:DUF6233 domain-containing protein n=1 Tax=Streptomyces coeruleorubidus TaxID=116188 RepID=UPI0033B941F6